MTIGIGFQCVDGVVLLGDQHITGETDKKLEHKVFRYSGDGWNMAFTYAGSPNVAKAFRDKFVNMAGSKLKSAVSTQKVRDVIDRLLASMASLDLTSGVFQLLCGITAQSQSILLKAEQRAVRGLDADRSYSLIGCGESELLHYLAPLFTRTKTFTTDQAFRLGVYLVAQGKKYIRDCGGPTDAIILKSNGQIEQKGGPEIFGVEAQTSYIEEFASSVGSAFFDTRISKTEFDERLHFLCKHLREIRSSFLLPTLPEPLP